MSLDPLFRVLLVQHSKKTDIVGLNDVHFLDSEALLIILDTEK